MVLGVVRVHDAVFSVSRETIVEKGETNVVFEKVSIRS